MIVKKKFGHAKRKMRPQAPRHAHRRWYWRRICVCVCRSVCLCVCVCMFVSPPPPPRPKPPSSPRPTFPSPIVVKNMRFRVLKKNAFRTDGLMDGPTDRPSYRDAWTHLKRAKDQTCKHTCICHCVSYYSE